MHKFYKIDKVTALHGTTSMSNMKVDEIAEIDKILDGVIDSQQKVGWDAMLEGFREKTWTIL
jgi:hypothetical protein